jgi:hypothetical protein
MPDKRVALRALIHGSCLPRLKRSSSVDQTVDRRRNGKRLVKTTGDRATGLDFKGIEGYGLQIQMVIGWSKATKEEFLPFGPGRSGVMSWLTTARNI